MPCPTDLPSTLCQLMPALLRLARQLTGNRDQAQDLCQEVLLRLWTRLQDGHEIDDLRAYAMAALRNQYRQQLRKRQIARKRLMRHRTVEQVHGGRHQAGDGPALDADQPQRPSLRSSAPARLVWGFVRD